MIETAPQIVPRQNGVSVIVIDCPPGQVALGGGFTTVGDASVDLLDSGPTPDARGWRIRVINRYVGGLSFELVAGQAVCTNT